MPSWWRLLLHDMRAAASRTFWTAGTSRPMRIAIIAITTRSSISVKPIRARIRVMSFPFRKRDHGTRKRNKTEEALPPREEPSANDLVNPGAAAPGHKPGEVDERAG